VFQLIIGINYHKEIPSSVVATRWMIRLFYGTAAIVACVSLISMIKGYTTSLLSKIIVVIGALPNVMIYRSLTFMGIELETSETISKGFDMVAFKLQLSDFNIWLLGGLMLLFIGMIVYSSLKLDQNRFLKEMLCFSVYFAAVTTVLSYCTSLYLGDIPFFSNISLDVNYIKVFLVPMILINVVSMVIYLIRKIKTILIKEQIDE
jgi:hypothetical protein